MIGAFLTADLRAARDEADLLGRPRARSAFRSICPTRRGPSGRRSCILVAMLVLFGVVPWLAVGPIDTATMPLLIASLGVDRDAVAGSCMTSISACRWCRSWRSSSCSCSCCSSGSFRPGDTASSRVVGWVVARSACSRLSVWTFLVRAGGVAVQRRVRQRRLAIFAKRLFLSSAAVERARDRSALRRRRFDRRGVGVSLRRCSRRCSACSSSRRRAS